MIREPELNFTTLEDLLEEDSLQDEPCGKSRCHCGRFAQLASAPTKDMMGHDTWQVQCSEHGLVWVS
jgi:hypothetical protein